MQQLHWFRVRWDEKSLYKAFDLIGIRFFFFGGSHVPRINRCGQFNTGNASPATVSWTPRLATEGRGESQERFGVQIWTSNKQDLGGKMSSWPPRSVSFPKEELMIPLILHNTGGMASMKAECWGLVGQKTGICKIHLVSPLLFWAPGAEQRRFWSPIKGSKARTSQSDLRVSSVFQRKTKVLYVLATD